MMPTTWSRRETKAPLKDSKPPFYHCQNSGREQEGDWHVRVGWARQETCLPPPSIHPAPQSWAWAPTPERSRTRMTPSWELSPTLQSTGKPQAAFHPTQGKHLLGLVALSPPSKPTPSR